MTRSSELALDTVSEMIPSGDHQVSDSQAAIAALERTLAELEARVAQLEGPPAQWLPLKTAAYDAGVKYETARVWAERGLIEARREDKRWFVNVVSLKARKERLAGRFSGDKSEP
jgi:hypothetical protein